MQSSRRLGREAGRNVEIMWLTGKLAPDQPTFRKENGPAIQAACAHFIVLCREIGLFTHARNTTLKDSLALCRKGRANISIGARFLCRPYAGWP